MRDTNLDQLKKEYMDIPIPKELDAVVKKVLKVKNIECMKKKNRIKRAVTIAASIAGVVGILTIGINISPVFAETLSKIPIAGDIVKVLTFREYTVNEGTFKADIKVPQIQGLENKELEKSLNKKYLEENKKLYDQFIVDMKKQQENGGGHLGVDSGYVIKTDTDRILSIGRYVVNTVGSSSTTFKYDTADKKNQTLITLPSLFKDESYVDIISKNIKEQMVQQHNLNEEKTYWVEGVADKQFKGLFEKISLDQNFYINSENKLVISFNKYEVAPGSMGIVEFVIPTQVISDVLVSKEYIK